MESPREQELVNHVFERLQRAACGDDDRFESVITVFRELIEYRGQPSDDLKSGKYSPR